MQQPGYETNDEINPDFIEKLKKKDPRWLIVEQAIRIENELRDSEVIKCILQVLQEDAEKAIQQLIDADPLDTKRITVLQQTIKHAKVIGNTLEALRRRGTVTQQTLVEEGNLALEDLGGDHGG